jgi:hypothetical protein
MKDDAQFDGTPYADPGEVQGDPHARLDCLTYAQLDGMLHMLAHLADAGRVLDRAGLDPVFALWPGSEPKITLRGARMPMTSPSRGLVTPPAAVPATINRIEIDTGCLPHHASAEARALHEQSQKLHRDEKQAVVTGDARSPEQRAMDLFKTGRPLFDRTGLRLGGAYTHVRYEPPAPEAARPEPAPDPVPVPAPEPAPAPAWTAAEDVAAVMMRRKGMSEDAIAARLRRQGIDVEIRFDTTLADWKTRALPTEAAPAPPPEPVPAPAPDARPRSAGLKQPGQPNAAEWTADEDARAIRLRRAGANYPEIAAALKRPAGGVSFRFKRKLADWATRVLPGDAAVADSDQAPDCRQEDLPTEPPQPAPIEAGKAERAEAGPSHAEIEARAAADAPAPAPDPGPAPDEFDGLHPRLRQLHRAVPAGVDPELDRDLAEEVCKGNHLSEVAADFGMDTEALRARWLALRAPVMTPGAKALTLDQQTDLLTVLRWRVARARLRALDGAPA